MSERTCLEDLRARREIFLERARYLEEVRSFFRSSGFLEVDAPLLVESPGIEPHLDAFAVKGSVTGTVYHLPTSPEFYLKKLLASGVESCFSLGPAFRDERASKLHAPEFLMLEWYRSGVECGDLVPDCADLLNRLAGVFTENGQITINGSPCDLASGVDSLSLSQVFRDAVGSDWLDYQSISDWREAALSNGAYDPALWTENDCFSFLMVSKVEPALRSYGRPVLLFGYPAFQAALARTDGGDERVSERFELFIGGVEIANAYTELTDGDELRKRFIAYGAERETEGKEPHPADWEFFNAVDELRPCAGIALGADRLLALLLGKSLAAVRHGTQKSPR